MKSKKFMVCITSFLLSFSIVMTASAYASLGKEKSYTVNASVTLFNNRSKKDAWYALKGKYDFKVKKTSGSNARFELKQWTVFDKLITSIPATAEETYTLNLEEDDYFYNAIYVKGASNGWGRLKKH